MGSKGRVRRGGRVFSMRGKFIGYDGATTSNVLVFDYVSPDRSRAWRVDGAWIWPITVRGDVGIDGVVGLNAILQTDQILDKPIRINEISDPTDNRVFAWAQNKYNIRDAEDDFMVSDSGFLRDAQFVIDPDTLVTKELYLSCAMTSDSSLSTEREWGYLIVLREERVSSSESLFQQIKGMGQNVGS